MRKVLVIRLIIQLMLRWRLGRLQRREKLGGARMRPIMSGARRGERGNRLAGRAGVSASRVITAAQLVKQIRRHLGQTGRSHMNYGDFTGATAGKG